MLALISKLDNMNLWFLDIYPVFSAYACKYLNLYLKKKDYYSFFIFKKCINIWIYAYAKNNIPANIFMCCISRVFFILCLFFLVITIIGKKENLTSSPAKALI